jgi:hypothetical protein
MKKGLKITLSIIGGLLIIIILVLGYFGFVPGVSALFGSSQPKDLGIKYTAQDLTNAYAKTAGNFHELSSTKNPLDSLSFSGTKKMDSTLTNQELTALANSGKWIYRPTKDVQIRINPDGTAEASGILVKDNLLKAAQAYGYNGDDIKKVQDAISVIPGDPRFYVKGKASIIDNKVNMDLEQAEIGRIDAKNYISDGMAESIIEQGINHVPGADIKSATFVDGQLKLDATLPSDISRVIN